MGGVENLSHVLISLEHVARLVDLVAGKWLGTFRYKFTMGLLKKSEDADFIIASTRIEAPEVGDVGMQGSVSAHCERFCILCSEPIEWVVHVSE